MRSADVLYRRLKGSPFKALVVQTAFLGDVILTTPLLRAIRNHFPLVQLWMLVREEWKEIVEGWVDGLILINKARATHRDWVALLGDIKRHGFEVAWAPHRSFRTGWLLARAGVKHRIGFNRGGGALFHNFKLPYPSGVYEGARNLALLQPFSFTSDDSLPRLIIGEKVRADLAQVKSKMGIGDKPYLVIAPGSVWATKRWNEQYYRELAEIAYRRRGWITVVVGAPADKREWGKGEGDKRGEEWLIDLIGSLSALEVAALMEEAQVVISGDTAAAHIASSVRVPQVVIYGSTSPRWGFFPPLSTALALGIDLWCRPCTDHGRHRCPLYAHPICLTRISPTWVWENVEELLKREKRLIYLG